MTLWLAALLTYGAVTACYAQWFSQLLSTPAGRRGLRWAQVHARRRPTEYSTGQLQIVAMVLALHWPVILAQSLRHQARRRALRR